MNIYKIHVQHFSQKDSHESIECFLLAQNDEQVYSWIDKEKIYGTWSDVNEEDGVLEVYDSEYNVVGHESFKQKMIRIKGEFFDEDLELSDLYYGKTVYGWEFMAVKDVKSTAESLELLGVLGRVLTTKGE